MRNRNLESAFREHGLPEAIRSDNGPPFASTGLGGLTELSAWLIRLGTRLERIEPGEPQQNGRHERMHLTLKRETASPTRHSLARAARRLASRRAPMPHRRGVPSPCRGGLAAERRGLPLIRGGAKGESMRRNVLSVVGAAALLVCAACKSSGPSSSNANQGASASDQVTAEQKNAEQSLKRAEDAQKKAGDEQKQATSAQQDVQDAQRKLTEAQQKEQKERAEAQQAQQRAQQEGSSSQQQAAQAQQRAAQAQQAQAQQSQAQQAQTAPAPQTSTSQAEQTVTARVAQVSGSELVLDQGNPSHIKLNDSTQVTVDGQPASADRISEGSQVRAAYRMDSGEPTAIRIEAKSK